MITLLLPVVALSAAADENAFVPFVIPAEMSAESLIKLPASPPIATDSPRLVARDGHFFVGDRRVRVWGVNTCFGANFPTHAEAESVARRLADFGVNSVRFHHMDSTAFPRGIWDPKDNRKLSAEALDRLDYFIDQLARRGIYANLNLHVSRTHSKALGLPDADKLRGYDKIVDIFTPELIAAQKAYARDLLTHVNAYRKVRYADDPAVAFVEINNEDSLFMWGAEQTLTTLPPHYAKLLHGRFIAWLKGRYGGDEKLRAAWGQGGSPLGEDMLKDPTLRVVGTFSAAGGPWRLEEHEGCKARPVRTDAGLKVAIDKANETSWHIQLNQGGASLAGGEYYTITFRARADRPRSIGVNVGQAHEPWGGLGLSAGAKLTGQWQDFRFGFVASADDVNARVNFQVGGSPVSVEIADVRLRSGGREGLRQGESLAAGKVALFADSETTDRLIDRWRFLAETEKAYFDDTRTFLKTDLGVKAMVTGTIVFGPLGLYGQSDMDYIDGHAYWQHPRFPGRAWDPGNWTVEPKAMVDHPDQSPLFKLAAQRLAGKPYTVSEYNHPAPNFYQAECVPMIASFAAAQDWDGVWLFAYNHRAGGWDRQSYSSFFDILANPAKWGFMPAGMMVFREGRLRPVARSRVVPLAGEGGLDDLVRTYLRHGDNLLVAAGRREKLTWESLLKTRLSATLKGSGSSSPEPVDESSGGRAEWEKGRFTASDTGVSVSVGRETVGLIYVPASKRAFVAQAKVSLDAKVSDPKDVRTVLVTVCGRCENTGMEWSKDGRTVGRNWGKPPVRIEKLAAHPSMRIYGVSSAEDWSARALKPDGTAGAAANAGRGHHNPDLELHMQGESMWYLLTRTPRQGE